MISEEEALNYAFGLSDLGRKVIALCSSERPSPFPLLAKEVGAAILDVQVVATQLQAMRLAVHPAGKHRRVTGIALTKRGEAVRLAAKELLRMSRYE